MTMTLDLSNCEREPIHIPGAIQPHGILFALDETDLRIAQVSENTLGLLGLGASELLGHSIEEVIGPENLELLEDALARGAIEDLNPLAISIRTVSGPQSVDAIMHLSSGEIVLELEPADVSLSATFHRFYHSVRGSIVRFDAARTVAELCDVVVDEVARLSGFDRVMAYRFDADWHGEVIAERCVAALQPFLGLRYPASDIPRQARDLFSHSWLRYIADVDYRPSAIVPNESAATGAPLDLSRAVLRSVSPIHIEYLRNMGVGATLTVSIMKNGELWGLIACHHRTARMVPYQIRVACEVIGRTMSLHLVSKEENEDIEHRMRLKSVQVRVLEALSQDADVARSLASADPNVLDLVGAQGAAIRYGDECKLVGRTPALADVMAIIDWLRANDSDELFVSDSLPTIEPTFEPLAQTACGIIALPLSRAKGNYVLWFRPEVITTVNWGGDPTKPVETEADGARLAPRKSFELWRQTVHLHALPWRPYEVEAAGELRHAIGSIIVERAEELERINRELARSNTELDSFAHTASHDLKEPLRGINHYASYLLEDYGSLVDAAGREKLETLVRLSERMDALIESHLQLSRVGKTEFASAQTNLRSVIDEVAEMYSPSMQQRNGSISFVSPLPTVFADATALREVFNNLFSNAMKYSEGSPHIEIGIDPVRTSANRMPAGASASASPRQFVTVFVRDNGIGIREKHLDSIFEMFKRLHPADRYGGGTGAGLAIARKIVERHEGHMWAQSKPGSGATFYFTLPVSG
jgi:chemotaxis family two-component system sensor kinase Cph1